MTTPNHAVQSALIQYLIYPKWYLILFAVLLGTIGDWGRFVFQDDPDDWSQWYEPSHKLTISNLLLPYHNLHILEDWFVHDPITGKWTFMGMMLEIVIWYAIFLFALFHWIL